KAMGGEFQIVFNLAQYEQAMAAGLAAVQLLEPLEDMMSYFRPRGELGRINALAAFGPVPVSQELWGLLLFCRELWEKTDHAFDITAGALWEVWGFARRQGRLPSQAELDEAKGSVGWHWIDLNEVNKTVAFRKPGIKLNLGSVGKGFAVDRLAAKIEEYGVKDFLLHGGKSSVLARGHRVESGEVESGESAPALSAGWPIGIANPLFRGGRLGAIALSDQSLATSGTAFQFFYHQGKRFGHVLDPRTGFPVEHCLSVTVVAPTAAEADALSTAFFVTGPAAAQSLCEKWDNVGAVFVVQGKSPTSPELIAVGRAPTITSPLLGADDSDRR
ncbi:MAG: FAD:protein FMN transferase, partial [Thermogutta sp.]|nr:FAD:protein FMN transferase [Thermogutta sp.]